MKIIKAPTLLYLLLLSSHEHTDSEIKLILLLLSPLKLFQILGGSLDLLWQLVVFRRCDFIGAKWDTVCTT